MNLVEELLMQLVKRNGSDLHLIAGDPPRMRINGELMTVRDSPLDFAEIRGLDPGQDLPVDRGVAENGERLARAELEIDRYRARRAIR